MRVQPYGPRRDCTRPCCSFQQVLGAASLVAWRENGVTIETTNGHSGSYWHRLACIYHETDLAFPADEISPTGFSLERVLGSSRLVVSIGGKARYGLAFSVCRWISFSFRDGLVPITPCAAPLGRFVVPSHPPWYHPRCRCRVLEDRAILYMLNGKHAEKQYS